MVRRTFLSFYIDPADIQAGNVEAAVQLDLARTFASARVLGAEVEPSRADVARASGFRLIGAPAATECADCYRVTVEATDDLMAALTVALEAVE